MKRLDEDDIGPREEIFQQVGADRQQVEAAGDPQSYNQIILAMIEDAESFDREYLTPDREEADAYYKGFRPGLGDDDDDADQDDDDAVNRTSIVATEVRDTILAILPSLIRIFTSQEHPVMYIPNTPQGVDGAAQATDYVTYVFMDDNPGFLIIHSILKDTMNKRLGVVEWDTIEEQEVVYNTYTALTEEQYKFVLSQEGAEVVEQSMYQIAPPVQPPAPAPPAGGPGGLMALAGMMQQDGPQPLITVYNCRVKFTRTRSKQVIAAVPPDEFRINRTASSLDDATLYGRHRRMRKSDIIKRYKFTREEVDNWPSDMDPLWNSTERQLRNPGLADDDRDPDTAYFGNYWIKIDSDGDGIDELHNVKVVGNQIVRDEIVDGERKFALFGCDPEPHTVIGGSVNFQVRDLQKLKTNVLRNTLDSLAGSIHPRMGIIENQVNMDDALSDSIGQRIRMKNKDALFPIVTPFAGEPALMVMQYLDAVKQSRTGISEASKGLDPKSLQSTATKGVEMVFDGAKERIELVARILAETGFKDMFKGLLKEITNNPSPARNILLRGKWTTVYPDAFDPTMSVKVNPSLGRGSDNDKFAMLAQILGKQEMAMQLLGPTNPIAGPVEWVNTIGDMLELAGIRDVDRYFKMPTPDQITKMQQDAANKPNPALILAQNETEKTRAKTVKDIADNQMKDRQHEDKMDLEWAKVVGQADQNGARNIIDSAKVGLDGQKVLSEADKHALTIGTTLFQHKIDTATDIAKHLSGQQHEQNMGAFQAAHEKGLADDQIDANAAESAAARSAGEVGGGSGASS